jgi:hypothetical protein
MAEMRLLHEEEGLRLLPWVFGFVAILPVIMWPLMPPDRKDLNLVIGFPLTVAPLMLVIPLARRSYRMRRAQLYDTIVKEGNQITIFRQDGTQLVFGPGAKRRKVWGEPDEILSENGVRYRLNRTRLFASDSNPNGEIGSHPR